MNRSLEPALTSLIPTYNAALPTELLQLARSILTQSQSKASSLKPEEEAARSYVCAHLACDRLKQTLNLPPIAARPPLPPRAYKKLYAYLDSAIPLRTTRHGPGAGNRTPVSSPVKNKTPAGTPSKATPSKGTPLSKAAARYRSRGIGDDEAPDWVMPAIRRLCADFEARGVIPHLYAGVCSVLKLCKEQANKPSTAPALDTSASRSRTRRTNATPAAAASRQPIDEKEIPALIVTLFIYIYVRLDGKDLAPDQFLDFAFRAIDILRTMDELKDGSPKDMKLQVNKFTKEAQNGWLDMEWFLNVEEGAGLDGESLFSRRERHDEEGEASDLPMSNALGEETMGPGSMMQGQVNYWSEDARRDFTRWKSKIINRIAEIEEANDQPEPMET